MNKEWFKKNKIDIILIIALFSMAFAIRTIPSSSFPDIYGFDSFWSARNTKYIITGEHAGWPISPINDTATVYPWGRINVRGETAGWWLANAAVYTLMGGTSDFDYPLFGMVASWMVAIMGSLAIPAIYLFGKEAYSRITGLASALFLTVSSSHLFYSIFGHAENDAFGLTLFFLCLFSFILTVKKQNWKYGLITLILFSWTSITWQSYNVVTMLFAGTAAVYFTIVYLFKKFNNYKESEERKTHRKWFIYTLLFAAPSGIFTYFFTGAAGYGSIGLPALTLSALYCAILEFELWKTKKAKETVKKEKHAIGALALLLIIGFSLFGTLMITKPIGFMNFDLGTEVSDALPYEQRMLSTIAEQNMVPGGSLFERINNLSRNFGISIWLAVISIVLIFGKLFIMPFHKKDFTYEWDILALAFIILSIATLTKVAISMFFLSGAVAFGAGYFFGFIEKFLNYFQKQLKGKHDVLKVALLLFLISSFFAGAVVSIQSAENFGYGVPQEWFSTFEFINTLPEGSVITAWWDYGHWINYYNGDTVYTSLDNIQDRKDIIYTVAASFTHTTECSVDSQNNIQCASLEETFSAS